MHRGLGLRRDDYLVDLAGGDLVVLATAVEFAAEKARLGQIEVKMDDGEELLTIRAWRP